MAGRDHALISGSILGFAKRVGNPRITGLWDRNLNLEHQKNERGAMCVCNYISMYVRMDDCIDSA
jgi:hypothetical protein